ncbi:MAG: CPXCG motif-containing cysteine-rich protein [Anaerolineae bacterium]|nr:CPXCG motif-containing cysteine-rich protein [Anaerolineae bacterium]MCO5193478.1 CPXCG motif-containing cysteine-rich protein [Anaerolineae bacterium]MCO5197408.1 CPXCG motif-containing cysteine-rich protein [Anaerolineae bacterium]MCO5204961.1 CPXCG motif-containing cysteine-rich protein [Anaerolineae bacterium]
MFEEEYFFDCPYCGVSVSMLLDLSVAKQAYVEDCEVCCNPVNVSFRVIDDEVVDFRAEVDD